jgi:hypothetical protein
MMMMNFAWRNGLMAVAAAGVAAGALGVGGCVERKIVIGSDPAGALVMLNDVEVGRTPVTVPFTWYGDYDVRLRLEKNVGTPEKPVIKRYYLHTHKKTETPWFETIGVDLLAELLPVPFVDEQVWAFPVPEVVEPTDEQLIERARQLKESLGEGSELKNRK